MNNNAPDLASDIQSLGVAAAAAMSDGMLERLVATGSSAFELVDRLNDSETKAAVNRLLDGLTVMNNTGSLDTIFEVVAMIHAARVAASDGMVERLTSFIESMVTNIATEEIAELARNTEFALYDAAKASNSPSAPTSLFGVLRNLFKPENVRMLNMMINFGANMQERSSNFHSHSTIPTPKG